MIHSTEGMIVAQKGMKQLFFCYPTLRNMYMVANFMEYLIDNCHRTGKIVENVVTGKKSSGLDETGTYLKGVKQPKCFKISPIYYYLY